MKMFGAFLCVFVYAHTTSTLHAGWVSEIESLVRIEFPVLTGFPDIYKYHHAGIKLIAQARIQSFGDHSLRIGLERSQFFNQNSEVSLTDAVQIIGSAGPRRMPIQSHSHSFKYFLEEPMLVRLKKGLVRSFFVSKDEPVSVTNIKRSLLAKLQLNLSGYQLSPTERNQTFMGAPVETRIRNYSVLEESPIGKCRTTYSIKLLPEAKVAPLEEDWAKKEIMAGLIPSSGGKEACKGMQYFQIIKTMALDSCSSNPKFQNISGADVNVNFAQNISGNSMSHVASTTTVVCGDLSSFLIRKIYANDYNINYPVRDIAEHTLYSSDFVMFELLATHQVTSELPVPFPAKEENSLVYSNPKKSPTTGHGYPTPGPQSPSGQDILNELYFVSERDWNNVRNDGGYDYIVVGTGPCALAFVKKILDNNAWAKILMLERGDLFLPQHFQQLEISRQTQNFHLGPLTETFPWTLSSDTARSKYVKYHHGSVPFFGGRSTVWSGWAPMPTELEMHGWPYRIVQVARQYRAQAEELLHIVSTDGANKDADSTVPPNPVKHNMGPVFGLMQNKLKNTINMNLDKVPELKRSFAAPLAVVSKVKGQYFEKWSAPAPLLKLVKTQMEKNENGTGAELKIATNCIVSNIIHQRGYATGLGTSRGIVNIGDAKVVLAMGAIPPATLIMNSFRNVPSVGKMLGAHFITTIIARIRKDDFIFAGNLTDIELGAVYVSGVRQYNHSSGAPWDDYSQQFHIQLNMYHDESAYANEETAFRYATDTLVHAKYGKQLKSSKGYLVFSLACLGEMSVDTATSYLRRNRNRDFTANIDLQIKTNAEDEILWDIMDNSAMDMLENIISPNGKSGVQYWHGHPDTGSWEYQQPSKIDRRRPGTVHETSTMVMGYPDVTGTSVGFDYRPHGVKNVYVTGAGLFPRAGSWNPTLVIVALAQHLADTITKNETITT